MLFLNLQVMTRVGNPSISALCEVDGTVLVRKPDFVISFVIWGTVLLFSGPEFPHLKFLKGVFSSAVLGPLLL